MVKQKRNGGFTLAEMLIVVAIVIILTGVGFIAVQSRQRGMTQLEYDTVAKELFIAAQNHLTGAESLGLVKAVPAENRGEENSSVDGQNSAAVSADDKVYFLVVNSGSAGSGQKMLELMLPFGAIDPTIFYNGSFIIRYQPSSARVLDVFYSDPKQTSALTIRGAALSAGDYGTLMGGSYHGDDSAQKENRRNYNGVVVGWYGGESANPPRGEKLKAPELIIHNEEKLWVEIGDLNAGAGELQLIITGATSGAKKALNLRSPGIGYGTRVSVSGSKYSITLDDITTAGHHFADLTADQGTFSPGENIFVEAVAYDNTALTNIAYSGKKTTNSLFADLEDKDGDKAFDTAVINNFRHLENLDANLSNFVSDKSTVAADLEAYEIKKADQILNLIWKDGTNDFLSRIKTLNSVTDDPSIYLWNSAAAATAAGKYYPVSPDYALTYDGQSHSISNVSVEPAEGTVTDAGLFGSTTSVAAVSNLELIDFSMEGTTSAGALAGTLEGCTVTNVLAKNSTDAADTNIKASSGSAGGLIGKLNGGEVKYSAAALIVSGSGDAGGLIGTVSGSATVTGCYSGGHTKNITEGDITRVGYSDENYNVTGATAGGLIGDAGSAAITGCYSTCSASGTTAGGFVGTASGKITNTYCTGLVSGTGNNAFIGSGTLASDSGSNYYYEIVNEVVTKDTDGKVTAITYKSPGSDSVTPFDYDAAAYNDFVGAESGWTAAAPYDSTLSSHFAGKYNLKSIAGLTGTGQTGFVQTHCGDWPAPEIFFVNES